MGKTSAESVNRYINKAYDRVHVIIPRGKKQAVKAFAESLGMTLNGLVNALLREALGLSPGEWEAREDRPQEDSNTDS